MNQIKNNFLTLLFALTIIVATGSVFYKFYFAKNYDFTIEVSCDPEAEECMQRDCEVEECPPNGFESYQTYIVSANVFEQCASENCTDFCRNNSDQCKIVESE